MFSSILCTALLLLPSLSASPAPMFFEAESFRPSSPGWQVTSDAGSRRASRATTLQGASGPGDATASREIDVPEAADYRIWVRYLQHERWRGPFRLAILRDGKELAGKVFDLQPDPETPNWEYRWDFFDASLPKGKATLTLSKYQGKNCSGYVRHVDCVLLTTDAKLVPNHLDFGPQTYLRVTLGALYDRPAYIHVFADHYRAPWYGHYHLSRDGVKAGVAPPKKALLAKGEQTPWCNITPMLYQDSGAILNITCRHTYQEKAPRLAARFEFATGADEKQIVRTIEADCRPGGLVIVAPPDLTTPENVARLKTDRQVAEETGKLADGFPWPKFGQPPQNFPFFVSARIGGYEMPVDAGVSDREWKTLEYFGFSNRTKPFLHGGIWQMKNGSYCQPDRERMQSRAETLAAEFRQSGKSAERIAFCMLMDEPTGQPASLMVEDRAYGEQFREWLKRQGLAPADLLVADWDAVRPVAETKRQEFPALHYYTQRFRTRALGDFMTMQREVLEKAYGATFPTVVNFSDGAVYAANFYAQGVDYFELLDSPRQNAIWGEDWANLASTYQCGAYNVDLMRAAARRHHQKIGHYLIAYAGRTPWDIKLKAAGEVARGVKILENFFYGPSWASHEGGPLWRSSAWYAKPETWAANAEIVREIGGAEDLLVPAMPAPAEVAILYSSSSDAWTLGENCAYGFDRMHTWLALTHAQVPVDLLSEKDAAEGRLEKYKVCYLSGPNLARAAAGKLKDWVRGGGTLWLTAEAGSRDEYNRPLPTLEELVPASRAAAIAKQKHLSAGKFLYLLAAQDEVRIGSTALEVLSVQQPLAPRAGAEVIGTTKGGSAGLVRGKFGSGSVWVAGFLPALAYIKAAEQAREELVKKQPPADAPKVRPDTIEPADWERLQRSANPWQFPAGIREVLLQPVRAAGVEPPLVCNLPLVDAVYMTSPQGIVIPLANYTLTPLEEVSLQVRVGRPIRRVESIRAGELPFTASDPSSVRFKLPLEATDFVKLYYR